VFLSCLTTELIQLVQFTIVVALYFLSRQRHQQEATNCEQKKDENWNSISQNLIFILQLTRKENFNNLFKFWRKKYVLNLNLELILQNFVSYKFENDFTF
jgi:hypothetical protein